MSTSVVELAAGDKLCGMTYMPHYVSLFIVLINLLESLTLLIYYDE